MTSTPANERSRASTISTPQHQPPSNLNKEDAVDWLAIDRALSHIQSVNPSDPYVLTIPQDVEPRYHHQYAQQARQWLEHTPFAEKEHEASQYLTWHFHEPGDMYVLHSTRPREEREEASSRVGTPKVGSGGAKKTMSLGAYKKKVAGGTPGPEETKKAEVNGESKKGDADHVNLEGEKSVKKPAAKGPVERVKADEEVLAAVEDGEDIISPRTNVKKEVKKDLKRKREEEPKDDRKEVRRKREDSKMSEDREESKVRKEGQPADPVVKREPAIQGAAKNEEPSVAEETARPRAPSSSEQSPAKRAKTSTPKNESDERGEERNVEGQASSRKDQSNSPEKRPASTPKQTAEASDMALPPRLSPLREDTKTDTDEDLSLVLPPRLSPTLPANITATLAARRHYRSTSKSSVPDDNLTPPRKALENGVARRKSPINGFRANSSSPMVRSDAEDARGRAKTSAPAVRSPSPSAEDSEIAVGRAAAVKKESVPRLLVKLKFKQRSTRESVKQLLKLPAAKKKLEPKPSPTALKATDARHREQRDTTAKGVAQKVGPATKGVAKKVEKSATSTPTSSEKRARDDESETESRAAKRKKADMAVYEPPAKRKKAAPEALDLKNSSPSTPSKGEQPPTPASTAQKPASQPTPSLNAPKKAGNELLAAATSASMKREASHDSQSQVATPSASSSSPAAPMSSQQAGSAVPKSTPTTASTSATVQPKTGRQKEWEAQRRIFDDLGRELKRAATADLNNAGSSKSSAAEAETSRRLAAVKTLESLLAYFIAFTSSDEAFLAAEPRGTPRSVYWRTLKDYFPFVKRNTEPYPLLSGLACTLAVVFCARILELSLEDKSSGSHEAASQAWPLLSHSAADAEAKLDVRKLQDALPKAWAESVDGAVGEEKLEPGRFGGTFKLPLGVQTKPVRAVRAAHAMLREWIEGERLGYEMRLKLD